MRRSDHHKGKSTRENVGQSAGAYDPLGSRRRMHRGVQGTVWSCGVCHFSNLQDAAVIVWCLHFPFNQLLVSRVFSIYNAEKYISLKSECFRFAAHFVASLHRWIDSPGGRIEKEKVGFLAGGAIDASLNLDIRGIYVHAKYVLKRI